MHPETGVQKVEGRWIAATPDDALHYFQEESGEESTVGSRIIALIDGHRSIGQIVDQLVQEFDVEPAQCEREVLRFIELMVQKKVLAP